MAENPPIRWYGGARVQPMANGPPSSSGAVVDTVPILPLRNSVVFPMSVVPINVGRARSVRLVEDLLGRDRAVVGIVSQKSPEVDEPGFEDIYEVGTVARVVKVIRLGPSNYSRRAPRPRPLAHRRQGGARAVHAREDPSASPRISSATPSSTRSARSSRESTRELLEPHAEPPQGDGRHPRERARARRARRPHRVEPHASSTSPSATSRRSSRRSTSKERVRLVLSMVRQQLELLRVKREISTMVADERQEPARAHPSPADEEHPRGARRDGDEDDVEELRERIRLAQLPEDAKKIAKKQLGRLAGMQQQSAEYNVTRTYLEWLADLPWSKTTNDKLEPSPTAAAASTRTTSASRR